MTLSFYNNFLDFIRVLIQHWENLPLYQCNHAWRRITDLIFTLYPLLVQYVTVGESTSSKQTVRYGIPHAGEHYWTCDVPCIY